MWLSKSDGLRQDWSPLGSVMEGVVQRGRSWDDYVSPLLRGRQTLAWQSQRDRATIPTKASPSSARKEHD